MSTVVDASASGKDDEERSRNDPFGDERIEVSDSELRAVSPSAWLEGVRDRLDSVATRFTYGR
ncbi:MAG: hypothetical protein ABEJ22_02020 [Haloferacaceae archaeon]